MENNQFYFFDQLSNEIKVLIIQKCDIKTVLNLSQTCKLMNEIINIDHSNIIFKELFYSTWKIEPLEYIISNWKNTFMKAHNIFQNFKSIDDSEKIENYIENYILNDNKLCDKVFFQDFAYQIGIQLFPKSIVLLGNYTISFKKHPFSDELKKKAIFYLEKAIEYEPENPFLLSNYARILSESLQKQNKRDEEMEKKITFLFQKGIRNFKIYDLEFYSLKSSSFFADFYFEVQNNIEKAFEIISFFDLKEIFESKLWFIYFKIILKKGEYELLSKFLIESKKNKRHSPILDAIINFEQGKKEDGIISLIKFIHNIIDDPYYEYVLSFILKNYSNLVPDFEKIFDLILNCLDDYVLIDFIRKLEFKGNFKDKFKEKVESQLLVEKYPNKINIFKKFLNL